MIETQGGLPFDCNNRQGYDGEEIHNAGDFFVIFKPKYLDEYAR